MDRRDVASYVSTAAVEMPQATPLSLIVVLPVSPPRIANN